MDKENGLKKPISSLIYCKTKFKITFKKGNIYVKTFVEYLCRNNVLKHCYSFQINLVDFTVVLGFDKPISLSVSPRTISDYDLRVGFLNSHDKIGHISKKIKKSYALREFLILTKQFYAYYHFTCLLQASDADRNLSKRASRTSNHNLLSKILIPNKNSRSV